MVLWNQQNNYMYGGKADENRFFQQKHARGGEKHTVKWRNRTPVNSNIRRKNIINSYILKQCRID